MQIQENIVKGNILGRINTITKLKIYFHKQEKKCFNIQTHDNICMRNMENETLEIWERKIPRKTYVVRDEGEGNRGGKLMSNFYLFVYS